MHYAMKLLDYVRLPKTVTAFEARYLAKVNRFALVFFAVHVPVLVAVAWLNGTRPLLAAILALAVLAGPTTAYFTAENPRTVSLVHGVSAMFFAGLLVHFGQGPLQIEMHFYFFALLGMLVVFANPVVIVAGAATVALHHVVLWVALPRSVFNYDAQLWVVGVHASFVILESIAACYVARSYFDNVIGLERIVRARIRELDAHNQDMRLVLDNVDQGFVTVDRQGRLCGERSRVFDDLFGGWHTELFDAFESLSPAFAAETRLAFEALIEGLLPFDVLLYQMPKTLNVRGICYEVVYVPIGGEETAERFLVVVTDVTGQAARARVENERQEVLGLFELSLSDRGGVEAYYEEATALIHQIATARPCDFKALSRPIHTLKGNSAIFGIETVAKLCHDIESHIAEDGVPPPQVVADLNERWARLAEIFDRILGARGRVIELDVDEQRALEYEARTVSTALWKKIRNLRLEPSKTRLDHFAEQSKRVAERLQKEVEVEVIDGNIRLDPRAWAPFWGALVHSVRNAVDHGIESPDDRLLAGKPPCGKLVLRTEIEGDRFVVEVADDGRGIDWEAVKAKAVAAGLEIDGQSALEATLFVDGVSTASEVTDVSGRGVGMGALLDATRNAGGWINVVSERGRGTSFRMVFPISAMAPENAVAAPSGKHAVAA